MRLLVVEDDPDLNRQLTTALTDAGYVVDRAFDGEEGHFLGDSEPYDAVVLDIGLPKMDGISVLEAWRRNGRAMPVLILTARDRWSDKVQGFDAGADDYVAKPFHLEEVLARIRALLRRSTGHAQSELTCGPVSLDTRTGRVSVYRTPSNFANGNTRDRQGRLVTCEHDSRRVTRTEYDGTITVVADGYRGSPLNSPNDVVVKSDDSIWFTDPRFGLLSHYEGEIADQELPLNVCDNDEITIIPV